MIRRLVSIAVILVFSASASVSASGRGMAVGGGTDTYGGAELLSIGGGAQFTSGVEAGERPAVSAELASSGGETQLISGEELLPAVAGTPSPAPEGEGYFKDHELPKFYPEYTLYPTGKGVPFYKYRTVQVAVPLVVAGGLMFGNDVGFRDMRNDFLGPWRYHYDDYLQYSSAAILVGLKAFGMKGRSSWGRMLTSSAFAVVGTVLMTNGTKLLRLRERPDGADRRSFPSGHTATAFVTATILHKEYGTTVSPWFSAAGYTLAAATGVSRVMNNKHWVSDILAGAGIGILAGELGYFIADKIFRDRGLLRPTSELAPVDNRGRPSFAGLYGGGAVLPLGKRGGRSRIYHGSAVGAHGAWFITPGIGFGGQLSALGARYRGRDDRTDSWDVRSPADFVSAQAGIYLSQTIGLRWLLSGKLLGGVAVTRGNVPSDGFSVPGLYFPTHTSFTATVGGAMTFVVNNHLGVKAFADLSMMRCRTETISAGGYFTARDTETKTAFPVTLGISFDMMLW